jgi:hypothetical protein
VVPPPRCPIVSAYRGGRRRSRARRSAQASPRPPTAYGTLALDCVTFGIATENEGSNGVAQAVSVQLTELTPVARNRRGRTDTADLVPSE